MMIRRLIKKNDSFLPIYYFMFLTWRYVKVCL